MKALQAFKHGLLGFGAGVVVSILFFPLNLLLAWVLLVLLLLRLFAGTTGGRVKHLIAGGVGLATVSVAIVLPVKQLDGRVGPCS
jgi:hypothetical protein